MTSELTMMNNVINVFNELKIALNTIAVLNNDDVLWCELTINNRNYVYINIYDDYTNINIECGTIYDIDDNEKISFTHNDIEYRDYFFNLPSLIIKWYIDTHNN